MSEEVLEYRGDEIRQKLNELADLQSAQDAIRLRKQDEIDKVLTEEIKAQLAEIDKRYEADFELIQEKVKETDGYIRQAVLELGTSIKGNRLHAVWNKGRVNWDTKALDGYAAGHPEIKQFRVEGMPSISIRPVVDQKAKPANYDPVAQAEYMRQSAGKD